MEELETLNLEPANPGSPAALTAADLPPAVRAFWDSAPAPFKVPAILTAIDCYCALATRLRFKYTYDLDPHALLLQVLVVAEAASGKSFTRPIVKSLMQPLKLRDQEMKRMEQAYQDLKKTQAKNKQLPEEPITDVRCLQTITKAKLVKRADMFIRKYGEPLTFWFYNEELATMTESNKRAFADLRTVSLYSPEVGDNIYKPLCDVATSKLARKTHIDMLNKVQINYYAAGLHQTGSDAVFRYTNLELKDRYELILAAFGIP